MPVERRRPPGGVGVEVAENFDDTGPIFDLDAARLAARFEADQQAPRRRAPTDAWLREGG
jgi:hypothetical protein